MEPQASWPVDLIRSTAMPCTCVRTYVDTYGKQKGCIQMKEKGCIQMSLTITTTTATATLAQKEYFCSVRALLPGLAAADVQWLLPMGHAQCQQSYWCCDGPAEKLFMMLSTSIVPI